MALRPDIASHFIALERRRIAGEISNYQALLQALAANAPGEVQLVIQALAQREPSRRSEATEEQKRSFISQLVSTALAVEDAPQAVYPNQVSSELGNAILSSYRIPQSAEQLLGDSSRALGDFLITLKWSNVLQESSTTGECRAGTFTQTAMRRVNASNPGAFEELYELLAAEYLSNSTALYFTEMVDLAVLWGWDAIVEASVANGVMPQIVYRDMILHAASLSGIEPQMAQILSQDATNQKFFYFTSLMDRGNGHLTPLGEDFAAAALMRNSALADTLQFA